MMFRERSILGDEKASFISLMFPRTLKEIEITFVKLLQVLSKAILLQSALPWLATAGDSL